MLKLHALPHSKRENNFGGKKALWGKYQPKPSLLCTAKRNWKMMNLGEESEVPFALPREKCLASSPHPNLSNCLIRTLQKAKRLGLERPFPWGTRPAAAGLQPFPGLGATTLVCVSGSCQDPSLSSGPDPFPSHPTRQRGKMLQGSSIEAHLAPASLLAVLRSSGSPAFLPSPGELLPRPRQHQGAPSPAPRRCGGKTGSCCLVIDSPPPAAARLCSERFQPGKMGTWGAGPPGTCSPR